MKFMRWRGDDVFVGSDAERGLSLYVKPGEVVFVGEKCASSLKSVGNWQEVRPANGGKVEMGNNAVVPHPLAKFEAVAEPLPAPAGSGKTE